MCGRLWAAVGRRRDKDDPKFFTAGGVDCALSGAAEGRLSECAGRTGLVSGERGWDGHSAAGIAWRAGRDFLRVFGTCAVGE